MSLQEARERLTRQGIPLGPEVVPGERGDCRSCGFWIDVRHGNLCWECLRVELQRNVERTKQRRRQLDVLNAPVINIV